jgi:hypothetical protein
MSFYVERWHFRVRSDRLALRGIRTHCFTRISHQSQLPRTPRPSTPIRASTASIRAHCLRRARLFKYGENTISVNFASPPLLFRVCRLCWVIAHSTTGVALPQRSIRPSGPFLQSLPHSWLALGLFTSCPNRAYQRNVMLHCNRIQRTTFRGRPSTTCDPRF